MDPRFILLMAAITIASVISREMAWILKLPTLCIRDHHLFVTDPLGVGRGDCQHVLEIVDAIHFQPSPAFEKLDAEWRCVIVGDGVHFLEKPKMIHGGSFF